ncbi:hypothetical protein J4211_01820 [Candidatus Woesearchaeota archaeon]|nr:hypothetical protein [Candidatus Woesearchaeota archaeon]
MSILSNLLYGRSSPTLKPESSLSKKEAAGYVSASCEALEQFLEAASAYIAGETHEPPKKYSTLVVDVKRGVSGLLFEDMTPISKTPWYFIGTSEEIDAVEFTLKFRADRTGARLILGRGEMRASKRFGECFVPCSIDEYVQAGPANTHYMLDTLPRGNDYYSFPPLLETADAHLLAA